MTRAQRKQGRKTIHSWKSARPFLEHWRKDLKTLTIELKQPRVIDAVPIDFVSGEPIEREGKPTTAFQGQLIYFTNADLTIRPRDRLLRSRRGLGWKDAVGTTLAHSGFVCSGNQSRDASPQFRELRDCALPSTQPRRNEITIEVNGRSRLQNRNISPPTSQVGKSISNSSWEAR